MKMHGEIANKQVTRRSLAMGAVSMVLCVVMLVATTFAWFTDTVSSKGNTITTGGFGIELWKGEETEVPITAVTDEADPTGTNSVWRNITVQETDADKIFNIENWQPGDDFTVYLAVRNNDSIDLCYNLDLMFSGEIEALKDYVEITYGIGNPTTGAPSYPYTPVGPKTIGDLIVDNKITAINGERGLVVGEVDYIELTVKFKGSARSQQMNKTLDIDVVLTATQSKYEDAHKELIRVYDATDFSAGRIAGLAQENITYVLMRDIDAPELELEAWQIAALDYNGYVIYAKNTRVADPADPAGLQGAFADPDVSVIFLTPGEYDGTGTGGYYQNNPDLPKNFSIKRDDVTFVGVPGAVLTATIGGMGESQQILLIEGCSNVRIIGVTFEFDGATRNKMLETYNDVDNITVENCTFNWNGDPTNPANAIYLTAHGSYTIRNNTFNNTFVTLCNGAGTGTDAIGIVADNNFDGGYISVTHQLDRAGEWMVQDSAYPIITGNTFINLQTSSRISSESYAITVLGLTSRNVMPTSMYLDNIAKYNGLSGSVNVVVTGVDAGGADWSRFFFR